MAIGIYNEGEAKVKVVQFNEMAVRCTIDLANEVVTIALQPHEENKQNILVNFEMLFSVAEAIEACAKIVREHQTVLDDEIPY